jgi:hypothetical protein
LLLGYREGRPIAIEVDDVHSPNPRTIVVQPEQIERQLHLNRAMFGEDK